MAQSATSSRLQVSLGVVAATAALGASLLATAPAAPGGTAVAASATRDTCNREDVADCAMKHSSAAHRVGLA